MLNSNLRKINMLLHALDRIGKRIDYYALDLDYEELRRTLAAVPHGTFKHVKCHGLHGTYDDGLVWLKRPEIAARPKCILSMGSSIGNFDPQEVAPFLGAYAKSLQDGDSLMIGIDKTTDTDKVYHAYNDKYGVTHDFILNGLAHANRLLGWEAFEPGVWHVHGEVDPVKNCHQAFVYPDKDVSVGDMFVGKGERIRIEHSYKYTDEKAAAMWKKIGVTPGAKWTNTTDNYGKSKTDTLKFDVDPRLQLSINSSPDGFLLSLLSSVVFLLQKRRSGGQFP
jgi:L-histidine Nalpha-methyltransferase / hercynylcysteine S-oxide synthase